MTKQYWKRVAVGTAVILAVPVASAVAQAPKAGGPCKTTGQKSAGFTCTPKGRRRVWVKAAVPATVKPAATTPGATVAPAATGLKVVPGFDGKTIRIGYLGNVSGGLFANGGKALTTGFNAYIAKINAKGGIAGKYPVEAVFAETEYNPNRTVQKYAELRDNVVMIGQVYGTPNMKQLQPRLAQDNMVGSPISLDAAFVKDPALLPIGSTYQGMAINLIDYYIKNRGGSGKKVCSLFYDSDYGRAGEQGLDAAVKAGLPFTVGPRIVVAATRGGATEVTRLKTDNCDAVLLTISGEFDTMPIMAAAQQLSFKPVWLSVAPSFNNDATQAQSSSIKATMKTDFISSTDSGIWGDASNPGMVAFEKELAAAPGGRDYILNPNYACTWGYANAILVVGLLEKAVANGDLSRDGIKKALGTVGKVPLNGVYPEYDYVDPAKRLAPSKTQLVGYDSDSPGGLKVIAKDYDSAAAQAYVKAL